MDNPFHVLALLGVSNDSSSLQYEYFYKSAQFVELSEISST